MEEVGAVGRLDELVQREFDGRSHDTEVVGS
jgi:hypothetical protein